MRIDRTHLPWLGVSAIVLAASTALYVHDGTRGTGALNGHSGGSAIGLTLGITAAIFMLFAGLLGARRRVRTWRIGRAEFWMRGHLWLGALVVPLAWLHGGFAHGGTLTNVLMWLLYLLTVSGVVGVLLQHFLPCRMTKAAPGETIYQQIPRVLARLKAEADAVAAACGPMNGANGAAEPIEQWRSRRLAVLDAQYDKGILTQQRRDFFKTALATAPVAGGAPMTAFYAGEVAPFLGGAVRAGSALMDRDRANAVFADQRVLLPPTLHEYLAELQRICEEARQLRVQRQMHHLMHGWLLVHVPLSYALLILSVVHAVLALRYS